MLQYWQLPITSKRQGADCLCGAINYCAVKVRGTWLHGFIGNNFLVLRVKYFGVRRAGKWDLVVQVEWKVLASS